ncbi:MAG: glycerol-3-phosphate 1-O-acyltransferase PlsY [Patescibacteria group bacterium]|nr:glycerol-3-phosphate 1-O-acyltransferase PlsY [Patescibacteria group bacterium]
MLFPMLDLILLIIFGYFLGTIPFGYLISRAKGIDIRKVGSGNIGATNVIRALGTKWGLLVAVLDVLKGIIPVYLALNFLVFDWQIAAVAITPVLGHIFPVWLGFKGGKGVATTLGVLFVLLKWKILLLLLLVWFLVLAISQISSFSNLLMVSFLPLVFWFSSFSLAYFILGLTLFALIWWVHRENLKRIKEGQEPKIKLRKSTQ